MGEQRESLFLQEREFCIGKNVAYKARALHAERQKTVALFPETDVNGAGFFKRLRIEVSAEWVSDRMEVSRGDKFVMKFSRRVGSSRVVAPQKYASG